jgi:glycosyltransferase involved in cell wall biosynthesis
VPAFRISLLTEIPAPFRIPLFNALAADPDAELEVLFLSGLDPKRPYPLYVNEFRFKWRILPGRELQRRGRWIVLSRGVFRALARARPSVVVIGGWNQPAFWIAAFYSRVTRTPLVAWVESTARDERAQGRGIEWLKRMLTRSCRAFLVPGNASAEYLITLGVDPARIAHAPNAVDIYIFGDTVRHARSERTRLRAELGLSRCTFLYVGRLDPEKGVDVLLEAARSVEADFAIIGAGKDADRLARLAPPNVRFIGRLERDALVPWYAATDAFVLPSLSDQWGMVLNEAATAGLPLVSTDAPGAAHDLVEDDVNGFRVPAGNAEKLSLALSRVAADEEFRTRASERSIEIASRYTPAAWAQAVGALCRSILKL